MSLIVFIMRGLSIAERCAHDCQRSNLALLLPKDQKFGPSRPPCTLLTDCLLDHSLKGGCESSGGSQHGLPLNCGTFLSRKSNPVLQLWASDALIVSDMKSLSIAERCAHMIIDRCVFNLVAVMGQRCLQSCLSWETYLSLNVVPMFMKIKQHVSTLKEATRRCNQCLTNSFNKPSM